MCRLYYAYPTYFTLLGQVLGVPMGPGSEGDAGKNIIVAEGEGYAGDAKKWGGGFIGEGVETVLYRMFIFFFDFVLVRVVGEWAWRFFVRGPLWWRLQVGFLDERNEIIIRRSRRWDENPNLGVQEGKEWWIRSQGEKSHGEGKEGEDEEKERAVEVIRDAVDTQWLEKKSGMVMANWEWDIDYTAMITAQSLLSAPSSSSSTTTSTENTPKTLQQAIQSHGPLVIAYSSQNGWQVHHPSLHQQWNQDPPQNRIQALKNELTRLGHESLFFRWVELMQYESSTHGDKFSREMAVEASKRCFEEKGVGWEEVVGKVGGGDGEGLFLGE